MHTYIEYIYVCFYSYVCMYIIGAVAIAQGGYVRSIFQNINSRILVIFKNDSLEKFYQLLVSFFT